MQPSTNCIALLQASERFSATPYLCPARRWTIGWGSTFYEDGRPVRPADAPITRERGDALMLHTLGEFARQVDAMVRVPLTQGQYDALTDFAYNAGAGALRDSTLLRKLNAGDYSGAAAEFDRWVYGGGQRLGGLVTRRAAERKLFEGLS